MSLVNNNFIGEMYLRDLTPISNNLDIELVQPQISYYEDSYMQNILGTNLYIDLKAKYKAQTLSPDEQTLVLLIKPCVAYGSAQLSIPFINTQIRNKGLNQINSENAVQSEIERARLLRQELRDRQNFYEERLESYLGYKSELFALYTSSNTDLSPIEGNSYECDIYIESSCGCHKRNCGCNGGTLI